MVPRLSVGPRGSEAMENSLASDSQMYWSSSLCLDVTTTVSATVWVGGVGGGGGGGGGSECAALFA